MLKWWTSSKVLFVPFYSPYPLLVSMSMMSVFVFFLASMNLKSISFMFLLGLVIVSGWAFDLFKEGLVGNFLETNISTFFFGFVLMIVSEMLLFFSFFWAFFHSLKTMEMPFLMEPGGLPLLNTFLLLSSGVSITLFHSFLFQNNGGLLYLVYTIFLGLFFEACQMKEYSKSVLSLASFTYGSVFFMLTGLHGFHVFVGLVCLTVLLYFVSFSYVNSLSLMSTECLIWYWHFVDIVWMFVYFFLYMFMCFFGLY